MTQRLNPFTAPTGVAALRDVESYLRTCGLDNRLLLIARRGCRRSTAAPIACTCTPKTRASDMIGLRGGRLACPTVEPFARVDSAEWLNEIER
jgi:hypothetical protein